jgi:hypothetical protein
MIKSVPDTKKASSPVLKLNVFNMKKNTKRKAAVDTIYGR